MSTICSRQQSPLPCEQLAQPYDPTVAPPRGSRRRAQTRARCPSAAGAGSTRSVRRCTQLAEPQAPLVGSAAPQQHLPVMHRTRGTPALPHLHPHTCFSNEARFSSLRGKPSIKNLCLPLSSMARCSRLMVTCRRAGGTARYEKLWVSSYLHIAGSRAACTLVVLARLPRPATQQPGGKSSAASQRSARNLDSRSWARSGRS